MNEERLAALEQRVGALEAHERDLARVSITASSVARHRDLADRLAALRSPGMEADDGGTDWKATAEFRQAQLDECRPERDAWQRRADEAESALATARRERDEAREAGVREAAHASRVARERDEAVALLREVGAVCACWRPCDHTMCDIISRARALVGSPS